MSAKRDQRYLLVVTVLSGRKFPHRPSESLRIDVRFDGQLLSSLPVPLVEDPEFDTDMAFRLSGKQLKDHKVQRTPIKIEVNKLNRRTKKVEKLGYQTLDLRSYAVEVGKPRFNWFALLGAQPMRGKPEVHIGVSVDEDTELQEGETGHAEFTRSARNKDYWLKYQPVLVKNPDGSSHYQLGPSKDSTHLFVLTITIGYASHLDELLRNNPPSPSRNREFFFHYELIDNHLTTKPFDDLHSGDFAPERVSLRLRSSFDFLREYLLHQRGIKINLCQGEGSVLASAELMYEDLFPSELTEISAPLVIEREIALHPVPDNRFQIPEDGQFLEGATPVLGVACEISILQRVVVAETLSNNSRDGRLKGGRSSDQKEQVEFTRTLTVENLKPFIDEIHRRHEDDRPRSAVPANHENAVEAPVRSKSAYTLHNQRDGDARSFLSLSPDEERAGVVYQAGDDDQGLIAKNNPENGYDRDIRKQPRSWDHAASRFDDRFLQMETKLTTRATQVSPRLSPTIRQMLDAQVDMRPDTKASGTQTVVPNEIRGNLGDSSVSDITHRYVCTIFLAKIMIVSPNCRYTVPIYLRYQYPFFGSALPIITRPPIEVRPQQDTILDNSLAQFSFGCTESQLLRAFRTAPVCIEVWRSGNQSQQDELIGQAKLRMDHLYRSETTTLFENEKPYHRRVYDSSLEVIDLQSDKYPKLAELHVCTTLDDYGAVQRQMIEAIATLPESEREIIKENFRPAPMSVGNTVREMEKNAAVELEMWKEKEEIKFRAQLKKREDEVLKNISEEWERRTKQQKAFIEETTQRHKDLEEDLRKMILENTQNERSLKERERRVTEADQFLKNEKIRLTKDIDEIQRNVIQEYTKRLDLEHSVQNLLKAEIKQMSSQMDDLKKQLAEREVDMNRLKDLERQKPFQEREMQAEIDRIKLDKNDLELRMLRVNESKEHYKQQWAKALKEVAKMRDRLETEHGKRFSEKEREVDALRLELLSANNKITKNHRATTGDKRRQTVYDGEETPRKQRLAMQFCTSSGGSSVYSAKNGVSDGDDNSDEENLALDIDGIGLSDGKSESGRLGSDEEETANPRKRLADAKEKRNVILQAGIFKPRDQIVIDLDQKILRLEKLVSRYGHGGKL